MKAIAIFEAEDEIGLEEALIDFSELAKAPNEVDDDPGKYGYVQIDKEGFSYQKKTDSYTTTLTLEIEGY